MAAMRNPLLDSSVSSNLPGDILECIFTRLDVRDVFRCQCVCKSWKDVISNSQFEGSQSSTLPMIFMQHTTYDKRKAKSQTHHFCIHNWWGTTETLIQKVECTYDDPQNYGSQNGFIMTRNRVRVGYEYIIRNPLTRSEFKIVLHKNSRPPDMFGIFFHPVRKEYCTLWRVLKPRDNYRIQYKMLNLGGSSSKPRLWSNIGDPWSHSWLDCGNPVCLDHSFMYWLVVANRELILMEFDIKNESMLALYPHSININPGYPSNLVVNSEGGVSIVQLVASVYDVTVKTWTLKERTSWKASECVQYYPNIWGLKYYLRAVAIENSELVFQAIVGLNLEHKLFVCNPESKLMRELVEDKYPSSARFWEHYPTIASLRNYDRVMHIHMNDE